MRILVSSWGTVAVLVQLLWNLWKQKVRRKREQVLHSLKEGYDDDDDDDDYGDESIMIVNA